MSDFRSIAAVTTTVRALLQGAVANAVPGAGVTTERPEGPPSGTPGVNVYLYRVTPNAALRNDDAPTRDADGTVVRRPRAAIDLHYLLSVDGDESSLEPQRILGSVVRALHAQATLGRQQIRDALAAAPTSHDLADNDLPDALEQVKLTPAALSLEELSKLWSVFFQAPYRLSIAYGASVVLIDGTQSPRRALPVLERNLYAVPLGQPLIESVTSRTAGGELRPRNAPILVGDHLAIVGQRLRGESTRLRVDGLHDLVEPASVSDNLVALPLASPPLPAAVLRAGVHSVQVVHPLAIGSPPVPHHGFESNVAAFVLRPRIDDDPDQPAAGTVRVRIVPPVGRRQRVSLLLDELDPPADRRKRAYELAAPPHNGIADPGVETTDAVDFDASAATAGTLYLVRVRVDGAESPLALDGDATSPTFNRFVGPTVALQ